MVGHPGFSELKFFFLALLFYLGDVHLKQQCVSEDGQLEPPGFEMRSVSSRPTELHLVGDRPHPWPGSPGIAWSRAMWGCLTCLSLAVLVTA